MTIARSRFHQTDRTETPPLRIVVSGVGCITITVSSIG